MIVYKLTASWNGYRLSVDEIEDVESVTSKRINFGRGRWAAKESGSLHETLFSYYDKKEDALAAAGRIAEMFRLRLEKDAITVASVVEKYPLIN